MTAAICTVWLLKVTHETNKISDLLESSYRIHHKTRGGKKQIWHYLMVFPLQLLGNFVLKENVTARLICKMQLFPPPQGPISQYLSKNKIPTDKTRTDSTVLPMQYSTVLIHGYLLSPLRVDMTSFISRVDHRVGHWCGNNQSTTSPTCSSVTKKLVR